MDNFLQPKIFGPHIFFDSKFFQTQSFFRIKIFQTQNIFGLKFFGPIIFSDPKFFPDPTVFRPKTFSDSNYFPLVRFLGLSEAYIPNISLLLFLEPVKSNYGWWWWVVSILRLVFSLEYDLESDKNLSKNFLESD